MRSCGYSCACSYERAFRQRRGRARSVVLALTFALGIGGCTIDLPVGRADISNRDAGGSDRDAADAAAPEDAAEMDDAAQGDAGAGDSGSIDAGAEPRILEVADVPSIMCADSLGGREAEFSALRAADVGLAGGDVELARTPSSLIVAGPPIEAAFGTPQLVLREDVVPDQPVGTLLGAVPVQGPSGPAGTQLNLAAMFVDTLMSPPSGEAGFQFETPNTDGACFLSFSIRLRDP